MIETPATQVLPTLKAQRRSRGRILAVRWGLNPNSSSLGVDITFLLFGLAIVTLLTPVLGFFLRFARPRT